MMDKLLRSLKNTFIKMQTLILLILIIATSIISLIYYYQRGLILAYGDAESHINIAKRVVSSVTPGFGQLGGNWLPFHHILMLPFIWNDSLWQSGLAGSFVSMTSFIFSAFFIFKLIKLITNNLLASWFGMLIFITNPNIIYMQATPMSELPLIATLVGAVYFFAKWALTDNIINIIFSAFLALCGTLIRYDAWFLVVFQLIAIVIIGLHKKMSFKKIEGVVIIFFTLASMGIFFWVVWNLLIFNDPLYFLHSPYSAKSQQLSWYSRGELPSYHNILSSLSFYTLASTKNVGGLVFFIACIGVLIFLFKTLGQKNTTPSLIASLLLVVPFPFYVITLFFGISIILLPDLVPATFQHKLFNARYGLMMMPAAVFFVAFLFSQSPKIVRLIIFSLVLFQIGLFTSEKMPIVLDDGINGLSSRRPSPANKYVAENYDFGFIMFDDFSRAANPVDLRIPMQKIIYVGNHPYWDESLEHPTKYIRWFIIRQDKNDVVWNKLKDNKEFLENYRGIYNNGKTVVYKRIDK